MKATSTSGSGDRPVRKKWPIVLGLVLVMLAVTGAWSLIRSVRNPLTQYAVTELESVTIRPVPSKTKVANLVTYDVNPQYWTDLLKNFRSAVVEWSPMQWQGLAVIEIHLKNGETVKVGVHDTGRETGCFEINGVYYSGGDETLIQRHLNDVIHAQEKARKRAARQ